MNKQKKKDVGRRVPAEEDTVSEVSEAELREWEEEQGPRSEVPEKDNLCSYPRRTSWRPHERSRRGRLRVPLFPFLLSFLL